VKHTEEEDQPKSRVKPRRNKESIDEKELEKTPVPLVMAKRLKPCKGHPNEKDPHAQRILPGHSGTCRPDNETEQGGNRPLTKGATGVQHARSFQRRMKNLPLDE
jgi:hypothetical protein